MQRAVAVAIAAILVLAGCASGSTPGTTSATGEFPATASPLDTKPATPPGSPKETDMRNPEPSAQFALTSPDFADGGAIPSRYTCDADNVSPPLSWGGAPSDAVAFALIVDDPDARGWVHWVVFDIPASATGSVQAGWSTTEDASPQGTNSFGKVGYGGPCPPSGTHRYVFRLLALDAMLALNGAPTADEVLRAARSHLVAEARLTATYRRG